MRNSDSPSQLFLSDALAGAVEGWSNTGWPGLTETSYQLFKYWFLRNEEYSQKFHICQQRAIETIVYCHEILQSKNLAELFEKICPNVLLTSQEVLNAVKSIDFSKYCLKMATGTGKTWVLMALLIWQYFNALNGEIPSSAGGESKHWYSNRFLIVAPGREVLNRLLDSFKGKRDTGSGFRDPLTADYNMELMMPESWRQNFNIQILEPMDIRANTSPPMDSFAFITNWQQFVLRKDPESLWESLTGAEVGEQLRGEFLAEFLSEYPSLVIMNDEAHHVHTGKSGEKDELVWGKFISILRTKLKEQHKSNNGVFIQYDFSATPYFGSGSQKRFFEHIVYDYDLLDAMQAMLVKQLFLEKRGHLATESLDFKAERKKPEKGKRQGELIGLSTGQLLLLEIGRNKLESITEEFLARGIRKKPVLLVLCEETEVAQLVRSHFRHLTNGDGEPYDEKKVMEIHTNLKPNELELARLRLDKIDDNSDSLNVVISVLMLREGFDRRNITVIVVLRASQADLLLEQIVGRGLRLMFRSTEDSSIWDSKIEALDDIRKNRNPRNSFDFLFIVEHPRFENFYQRLKSEGYLIPVGDSSTVKATGDVIPVDAVPLRLASYDIAWPEQIFEQESFPDLSTIDVSRLPPYSALDSFSNIRDSLGKMTIQDVHYETGKKTRTWKFVTRVFRYNTFLSKAAHAVAEEGKSTILSNHLAEIAGILDEYVSKFLFREEIDFQNPKNSLVLNNVGIFDFIVDEVRKAILNKMKDLQYEQTGNWRRLSDLPRLMLREKSSVETWKTIYPRQGFEVRGGGFEKKFMINTLEQSSDVLSFAKLDKKHSLKIPYRDEYGIMREYQVDFIIKTVEKMYLLETKADKDLNDPSVLLKAKAAHSWCKSASGITPPNGISQPKVWEYLILSEGLFEKNSDLGFEMFVPFCREQRNRMIERYDYSR